MDFRVKDFFGTGKARFGNDPYVHVPDCQNTGQHIFPSLRIGLVEHALVAHTDGTGLIRVDPRDNIERVFYLFLYPCQAPRIFEDSRFIIRRAGTDDKQKAPIFPRQDAPYFLVPPLLDLIHSRRHRVIFPQLLR